MTDKEALDELAEFVRLPEWNIGGSMADFIECMAEIVSKVRDTTTAPNPEFATECGF